MKSPPSQVRKMLDAVRADLPELTKPDPQKINVPTVLLALAETWPGPLDRRRRTDFDALCRQVAVAKRVLNAYDPGWKKAHPADLLGPTWWPLLIAVLLAYASPDDDINEAAPGLALKSLNAALSALDIAQDLNTVERLPALRQWAHDVLETVPCEVGQ